VPGFTSVTINVDPDPGISQNSHSYQVASDATLTLSWTAENATVVTIDPLSQGLAASGQLSVPTQESTLTLIAFADDGSQSQPYPIDIHTNDPGDVVSPHADVGSGAAAVVSYTASLDGQSSVHEAKAGDQLTLVGTFSEATEAARIADQDVTLSDPENGTRSGSVQITLIMEMTGDFQFQALKGGSVADTQQLHIDISATPTTEAPPTTPEGEAPYTTIWNNAFNFNLPKIDGGDHLAVTLGVTFTGTLECKTADAQPVSDLPGDWKTKASDAFSGKWGSPIWQAFLNGGQWKAKEYSDFWSHFTLVDSSATKNGGLNAKTEISANIAEYDIGEYDFVASGGLPAAQAKLSVAVGQVNCVEVWKSAFGVATGSYAVNLVTDIITDGDYKLTGTYSVTAQIELKGPTLEAVAEKVAANPVVIEGLALAAVILAVAIVLIWVENEIEQVDQAASLPPHIAKAYSDGVWSGFSTGPEHDIDEFSDGSGFTLTPYFQQGKQQGANWLKQNPNATDDQKQAAKGQALAGATDWAKDATFQTYKSQNHPADLTNEVHQRIFGTPDPDYKGGSPEGGAP
jgi:hypothetical protein